MDRKQNVPFMVPDFMDGDSLYLTNPKVDLLMIHIGEGLKAYLIHFTTPAWLIFTFTFTSIEESG
ncbi:hypothetical protein JOC86_000585 [Bacillus pakistanensis]|uniref:Uncharacterized protein n=1 Tax=Rossellomorea pakistanensis TaxID=992288 RepID=A0ABS2N888_9BACI|nr:hypothetical protein [Bacillus pakistanensis]